jgi:Leucine-rich repeat (LRR) protein
MLCVKVSHNALTGPNALPASFGSLAALVELNASNNKLTALPASFAQLRQLQVLALDNNQLTPLHNDVFAGMSGLVRLTISNNPALQTLPASMSGLTKLQTFEAKGCGLQSPLPSLEGMSSLTLLDLRGTQHHQLLRVSVVICSLVLCSFVKRTN